MYSVKVTDAVPLKDGILLVFFEDGKIKTFDTKNLIKDYPEFEALQNPDLFCIVKVEPGGYGVSWNEDLDCSEGELYENGIDIPLDISAFLSFCQHNLITTKEAAKSLDCSTQNIDDLVKRGKLHPILYDTRYKLFIKSEVNRRNWK